jgi:hypothetical protein
MFHEPERTRLAAAFAAAYLVVRAEPDLDGEFALVGSDAVPRSLAPKCCVPRVRRLPARRSWHLEEKFLGGCFRRGCRLAAVGLSVH